ncbi:MULTISPECIES: hypothetical protein [Streptomyces]|uniref:hypothetical protein n=1 Tax=Streptomyces TaxID=1883 RepID=UPI00163C69CE|nr:MULTISPECIES: hypothetical protein [Streptomyces]MBC2878081.1 hypothetical protein [Streptomyces sp. TYQ1024]UBI40029.1 hypothetical protein K7I03_28580 [Streptomyces mobaraensis]UKW32609.1 hypothetical protein MCU78_28510 [Streptomyces sp. TYQ1024]
MPHSEPDPFHLDGYEAESPAVEEQFWQHIAVDQADLTVLAQHHTDDDKHSFYVLHDGAATWGVPGEPQIIALHLQRDPAARAFRFQHAVLPLPAMAQSWLIARGCPKEAIGLPDGMGTRPADETTRALQERLMTDGDHFALLHSYTDDTTDRPETVVLLRALDERAPLPFRILLEEADLDAGTHTLREGAFATYEAATEWCEDHLTGETPALPAAAPPLRRRPVPLTPARPAVAVPPRGRGR